jgi:hypothetical protein
MRTWGVSGDPAQAVFHGSDTRGQQTGRLLDAKLMFISARGL